MSKPTTVSIERSSLLDFLKKNEYNAEDHAEQEQILVKVKVDQYDFPMFLRPIMEGELLQILTFIPCKVEEEYFADLGRLLHMLNKEMDMPGLGMDELSKTVFYRCMAPCFGHEILEKALFAYLNTSNNVVNSFAPVIAAVATGKATFEEVLKMSSQEESAEAQKETQEKGS